MVVLRKDDCTLLAFCCRGVIDPILLEKYVMQHPFKAESYLLPLSLFVGLSPTSMLLILKPGLKKVKSVKT